MGPFVLYCFNPKRKRDANKTLETPRDTLQDRTLILSSFCFQQVVFAVQNMSRLACKIFILLIFFCVGCLCIRTDRASGLRSAPILHVDALQELNVPTSIAPAPAMSFTPYQSEKRRFRRGPDPIHNKC